MQANNDPRWRLGSLSTACAALLVFSLSPAMSARASGADVNSSPVINQIDATTIQHDSIRHPAQIALETSTGNLAGPFPDRLRRAPVPAPNPWGLSMVPGTSNQVYFTDNGNGSLYKMNADTGDTLAHIVPADQPSKNLQGVAPAPDGTLYLYYNTSDPKYAQAPGVIEHITQDGTVLDKFDAPTGDGNSLALRDGWLFLLDGSGTVYKISPTNHGVAVTSQLTGSTGHPFAKEDTFGLFYDGKHWNLTVSSANWHVFQYDDNWNYTGAVDLQNGSITGCAFNGQDYYVLNISQGQLFTERVVDGVIGDGGGGLTSSYQYAGGVRTTDQVFTQFPKYDYKNVVLIYDTATNWTADRFKPYVSYVDPAGVPQDTLFDAFLFAPNGNAGVNNNSTYDNWSSYLNKTMGAMTALDKEWASRNQALHLTGDQAGPAKVFFMLPNPSTSDPLGYREQLLNNFVDSFIQSFNNAHFQNLKLAGFDWINEEENYSSPLVVNTSTHVHALGYQMMWIPDQYAWTADDRFGLGIDQLYRQSHYYFDPSLYSQRKFFDYAYTGARYGTGIELELDDLIASSGANLSNLQQTIEWAAEDGLLYGSKAWYVANTGIESLAASTGANRAAYDLIHQAVSGSYRPQNVTLTPSNQEQDGLFRTSQKVNLPANQKLRLTPIDQNPNEVESVTFHVYHATVNPVYYSGPIAMSEELRYDPAGSTNGQVVKQSAGTGGAGIVVGFGQDYNNPLTVWFTSDSAGATQPTKIEFPINKPDMKINGVDTRLDVSASVVGEGRALVPVRYAAQALGLSVAYLSDINAVELTSPGQTILLPIGSTAVESNNSRTQLDVSSMEVSNRVLVPIRFISETLGATVDWNQDTQTVIITK
ncbi:MAG: hypothetical protein JWN30_2088 [Bacilli bacterium]|nr:hypothetical protein [Bacilli bacterium]